MCSVYRVVVESSTFYGPRCAQDGGMLFMGAAALVLSIEVILAP
jgi:hypothetical protein